MKASRGRFRFFPYFWLASLAVISLFGALIGVLITREVRKVLIEETHDRAVMVLRDLNERIADLLRLGPNDALPAAPLDGESARAIRDEMARLADAYELRQVYLFNRDGLCILSLDGRGMGDRMPDAEAFERALSGRRSSELHDAGEATDFRLEAADLALLESHAAFRAPPSADRPEGRIVGVLETYQDVSPTMQDAASSAGRMMRATVAVMALLFLALYVVARRANRILDRQTGELEEANAGLEDANRRLTELSRGLETKVEERSRRLLEQEKLASLGTLAAGVAHEINSPIGIIATSAEGLLARLEGQAAVSGESLRDLVDYLQTIRDEAFRCKQVTRDLLDFARNQTSAGREVVPVRPALDWVLDLCRFQANREHKKIEVADACPPGASVRGDANQIKQVFFNLTLNALEALPAGGGVAWELETADGEVVLRCRDCGAGIDPANLPRLFDPFFTTKPPGKGTGLGLSVAYGIVRKHSGDIRIESAGVGRGTTVTVRLPRAREDAP